MGYYFVMGPCFVCGTTFSYNPNKVPSIRVDREGRPDMRGRREAICESCMEEVNRQREAAGLLLHAVDPEAYKPCPEGELDA